MIENHSLNLTGFVSHYRERGSHILGTRLIPGHEVNMTRLQSTQHASMPILLLMTLLLLSGCMSRYQAQIEAEDEYARLADQREVLEANLGISDPKVFGHDTWFDIVVCGRPKVTKIADTPLTFAAVLPFWVRGETPDGRRIKQQQILHMTLQKLEGRREWHVKDRSFELTAPLSLRRQIVTWALWVAIGPTLLFLWIVSMTIGSNDLGASITLGYLLSGLATTPIVIYVSWVFSASIAGTVVGLIAFLAIGVLARLVLGMLLSNLRGIG